MEENDGGAKTSDMILFIKLYSSKYMKIKITKAETCRNNHYCSLVVKLNIVNNQSCLILNVIQRKKNVEVDKTAAVFLLF